MARFTACAKSPLTRIWRESNCGGSFAPELKLAGYDGIAEQVMQLSNSYRREVVW
ncbi:MAG: aldehyde ferredoxin oxidoreductase N-terminal domain-containing protein [Dehalococcoidia bacterium]